MTGSAAQHLAIVGPTATGKSAVALALARRDAPIVELVSVDSMQVYRGMDIGTAKPTAAEQAEVPHHLIDLVDPDQGFTVSLFQAAFAEVMSGIDERCHRAVLVGGTGLYLRATIDGLDLPGQWPDIRVALEAEAAANGPESLHGRLAQLDPLAAQRMEPTNTRRVVRALEVTLGSGRPFSEHGPGLAEYPSATDNYRIVGLRVPREEFSDRIANRFHAMLDAGLLDEVRTLAEQFGPRLSRTARQALGYRELLRHVEDGDDLDECIGDAIARTRRFAVRQDRWFRRDPRIEWLDDPNELTIESDNETEKGTRNAADRRQ